MPFSVIQSHGQTTSWISGQQLSPGWKIKLNRLQSNKFNVIELNKGKTISLRAKKKKIWLLNLIANSYLLAQTRGNISLISEHLMNLSRYIYLLAKITADKKCLNEKRKCRMLLLPSLNCCTLFHAVEMTNPNMPSPKLTLFFQFYR